MSQKTFTIRKAYVLSAINKQGERVYYDTDDHSGGWPYWSTFTSIRKEYASLDKVPVIKPTDYMYKEVNTIEVLEVKRLNYQGSPVDAKPTGDGIFTIPLN